MNERIKELRKSLKLSQRAFADGLGFTEHFIYLIEKGDRTITDRTIRDVCRVYGVSEAWLRFGLGDMYQAKEPSGFLDLAQDLDLSEDEYDVEVQEIAADLMRTWAELTPEHKRVVLDVVHRFRNQKKKDL